MEPGQQVPDEQVRGLLAGVGLLRLAVLGWATVVVAIDMAGTTELRGPVAVATLVALALWTSWLAWGTRHRPARIAAPALVATDVAVATGIAAADHWVYAGDHPQTFASAWPLGAVVTAGILRGPIVGGAAGAVVGLGGALGTATFGPGGLDGRYLSTVGTLVLLVIAGALSGIITDALRRAESTAARARAREDFARDLHDGVLQTLAAVQRRSDDPDLAALAREQELELRHYIDDARGAVPRASAADGPSGAVEALRAATVAAERRSGVRCELVVVDQPPALAAEVVESLRGAVSEAVTNAAKHGAADRVVVCLEADDDGWTRCTVSDDGAGFDPARVEEGVGISRSIRGRLREVGGQAEVLGRPGRGCEVVLRVPPPGRGPRRN